MLKACQYCGRIHPRAYDCGKKPKRIKFRRTEAEAGRYSYAFSQKSREIKERAHYLCQVCLAKGRLNYMELETHHIIKLSLAPELLLADGNLVCLCRDCHRKADKGLIDAAFLRKLAKERDLYPPRGHETTFGERQITTGPASQHEKFPK